MDLTEDELRPLIRAVVKEIHRESIPLSREDSANIALAAAKEAVRQNNEHLFGLLGIDIANRADQKRWRGNFDFLDALHRGTSQAGSRVLNVSLTTLIGAALLLLWWGLKAKFGKA